MKQQLIIVLIFYMQQAVGQTTAFATIDSLLQRGRYQIALQKLKNIAPPTFEASKRIANVYRTLDNTKEAIVYYEKALEMQENVPVQLLLASAYKKVKYFKKSVVIYEELSEKDSLNLLLQYNLAKLYLLTKDYSKSVKKFQFLINKDPKNANYSYRLGVAYFYLGERNKKIDSYLDAYRKDHQHIKALYHLATAYKKIGNKDSSYLFVEKGLQVNPNHIQLNRIKINRFYRKKKYKLSIQLLKKIDSLAPDEFYTAMMLGKNYYNIDSLVFAKKYFNKAVKLDTEKEDFKAYTYMGHIAVKEKNYLRAKFYYMMATIRGKRKRDEEYFGLAMVFLQQEKKQQAIAMLKRASQENRYNYKVAYRLATLSDSYYKKKKIAYNLYKKYLQKFEDKDAKMTAFIKRRMKEIKKKLFLDGEKVD